MGSCGCFVIILLCCCYSIDSSSASQGSVEAPKKCQLPNIQKAQSTTAQSRSRECPKDEIATASSKATDLYEQIWQWKLEEFPEDATHLGIHQYDDRLNDISIEAFNRRYTKILEFLEAADRLEPCLKGPEDSQNLKLLKNDLLEFKKGHKFNGYYFYQNNLIGIEFALPHLLKRMPLKSLEDYQKMISRMEKVPDKVEQIITLMKSGMAEGLTHHYHSIKNSNETIAKLAAQVPTATPYYKFFLGEFPPSLTQQQISVLQEKALNAITNKVVPALSSLGVFLTKEYKTREKIAATSLPNGEKFYKRLVRLHTTSPFTPQEIHDVGLCEVKRINAEMTKTAAKLGYTDKTLNEVTKKLKDDPKNYYATKEELLKGYEEIIKVIDLQLLKIFKRVTSYKVKVEEDPSPTTTLAYYRGPTLDGLKPGVFVVGTNNTRSNPKYNMMTLTIHEALPGHHLQISHAIEFGNFPKFRRAGIANWKYLPSGFSYATAYVEGWALYSETLGFKMNLFDDPLYEMGHYTWELLRACRLVVDTGMHYKGWTREQAIDFMDSNLALDRSAIAREVDRYITWPGQALAYKIGQMRILAMREKAEQKLKDAFDIKDFHDVVLNTGAVPLDFLEEEVDNYIAKASDSRALSRSSFQTTAVLKITDSFMYIAILMLMLRLTR